MQFLLPTLVQPTSFSVQMGVHGFADTRPLLNINYRSDEYALRIANDRIQLSREWVNNHASWILIEGQGYQSHATAFPWENGAPALWKGYNTSYTGIWSGQIRDWQANERIPGNFFVGGEGKIRYYWFHNTSEHQNPPDSGVRISLNTIFGWNAANFSSHLNVGQNIIQSQQFSLQPFVQLQFTYEDELQPHKIDALSPWIEGEIGWGDNLDDINKYRVGGLHPIGVQFAGAGWGEWWLEDFSTMRLGMTQNFYRKNGSIQIGLHADFLLSAEITSASFGQRTIVHWHNWSSTIHWGYAPWIPRQQGVPRISGYGAIIRTF
jgi:hypothetical protein